MKLVDLRVGEKGRVSGLTVGWRAQRRLMDLGIHVGTELTLLAVHPWGGPLLLRVGGTHVALGRGMAGKVSVETAEDDKTG